MPTTPVIHSKHTAIRVLRDCPDPGPDPDPAGIGIGIGIPLSNLSGSGRDGFQRYGTGSGRVWTLRDGIEIFRIEIDLFMYLTAIFLFITRKKEKNIHVQDTEHYFHMNKRKIYIYMFKMKKTIFTNIHFRSRSNCYHRYHISIFFSGSGRDRDGFHFE